MKISTFKTESHLPASLIDAVINQLGGKDSFKESAPDIANHGIDGGFHGFIYYTDTVQFARDNLDDIIKIAEDMAQDIGESGAFELIAGFSCFNEDYTQSEIARSIYTHGDENETEVLNGLAWFAGEEVARSYCDLCGNQGIS